MASVALAINLLDDSLHRSTCFATKDGQWGGLKDGKWTGMIGDIVNGRADIALASLDITQERSTAVDFLMAVVRTE